MSMSTLRETIAMAVAVVVAPACNHGRGDEQPARPVRVETIQRVAATGGLRYSASIQPYEQVALAFKVGGYVEAILQRPGVDGRPRNAQQGDVVTRGTLLARIARADYREKVNYAASQAADAEARLVKARADAARGEALYQAEALTRPDYDATTAALASATASADGARAQLESARISLADASLAAPSDGIILSRSVEVGTLAGAGAAAFTLADLTRVKAVFGVPDLVVERVHLGARLRVTTDAFGAVEFPGRVTAVSPSADAQSRVFNVEITIPNRDRHLKAGMIATVEVASPDVPELAPGSRTVSVAAVVKASKPGGFAVFVAEGNDEAATATAREVTLGAVSGNRVTVTGGLREGERVVVSGASLLTTGDRVRVIPGAGE
jgi:RND family efflux transporter MFP subunit